MAAGGLPSFNLRPTDAAVVLTHSLEQDTRILAALIEEDLAYIGVLGPQRRTAEILATLAEKSGLHASRAEAQILAWLERLHAPMGLDLGGDTPADVAISVIAEIQQSRHRRTGLPLRQVRARAVEMKRASA
jgi:xanthine/CO dehydrogenase XdhC/CoxF family maturation factor